MPFFWIAIVAKVLLLASKIVLLNKLDVEQDFHLRLQDSKSRRFVLGDFYKFSNETPILFINYPQINIVKSYIIYFIIIFINMMNKNW